MDRQYNELFTEKVTAGKRTYFFDVKKNSKGDNYLVISEQAARGANFERHRLMVFPEYIKDFKEGFDKAFGFMTREQ